MQLLEKDRMEKEEEEKKVGDFGKSIMQKAAQLKNYEADVGEVGNQQRMKTDEDFKEENMIVASWIDDLGNPQKEMEDKVLFYNNESIINNESMLDHFSREHRKVLNEKMIEYQCKKGKVNQTNQDNFFTVMDGDIKIFGVFDGHGMYGHLVSGFAAAKMLDYIRNHSKTFHQSKLLEATDEQIKRALKKCFKFT